MRIVLIGIQGAGKSTQGNLLSRQLGVPYLSTGHILREMAKEKTQLGRYIKETINAGILVPDEKMIPILEEYLSRDEYQNGYILDGFPRTLVQAKMFDGNVDKLVYLKVPDREALWRIAHRKDSTREDETLVAIKKRIELFHSSTTAVIEYFRRKNKLVEIDGTKKIDEVNKLILKELGKTIGKNGLVNWRKRNKVVLALVGLPGAGKDVAAQYFSKKGLPIVRLGDATDEVIKEKKLPFTNEVEKQVREELRKKNGMDVYIKLNEVKIHKLLEQYPVVIVNGMRSWEENLRAIKVFERVFVVSIVADKKIRYRRIKNRKTRTQVRGEDRDLQETLGLNMGPTIALADKTLINNGSLSDFEDKLEEVYRQVYYGMT